MSSINTTAAGGLPYTCLLATCYNETQTWNKTKNNHTLPLEMFCVLKPEPEELLSLYTFQTCVYVMYGIIFIAALLGNGLVCFVVQSSPRMKTVTNYFILNLAVGDILMTLFCVPFSFISTLILRYWPFGRVMCKVVNYSQAVSVLVSAYTLLAISIDRYLVITRPLRPRLGKTSAKLIMTTMWFGALVTALPIVIVSDLQKPSLWHQVCQLDICTERWGSMEQSEQYTIALLILQFALPLASLICTYVRIACVVLRVRPPGEAETLRDSRIQHSKLKMVKMMITVVTVFTICWLPLNVFIILWTSHENDEEWGKWPGMPYVWFVSHWLAMSHSCYNPIIYCYMNEKYRNGFKQHLNPTNDLRYKGLAAVSSPQFPEVWRPLYSRVLFLDESNPAWIVQVLGRVLRLNTNERGRSCNRSSVCDGVPLSEMIPNTGQMVQKVLPSCKRRTRSPSMTVGRTKCSCISITQNKTSITSRPNTPAQALSIRSQYH